jgi:hypothetical protein
VPNPNRPDFNPSPFSTRYPSLGDLSQMLTAHGFQARTYGDFPVEPATTRDRMLEPVRSAAVRLHLVPRSMRMKAMVKRVLYGKLPKLGAVHDGMAAYAEPTELEPNTKYTSTFKTLYAVGVASSR